MVIMLKPKTPTVAPKVADGIYPATLTKVTSLSNSYGQRIGFEFTLDTGEKIMRSTSPVLSDKGQLTNVLQGLLGRDLTREEIEAGVDAEELLGTCCQVLVVKSKSKAGAIFSNIEKVLPAQHKMPLTASQHSHS
jgi:hypothetical protein